MEEVERPGELIAGLLRDLGCSTARSLHRCKAMEGVPASLDDPLLVSHFLARAEHPPRLAAAAVSHLIPVPSVMKRQNEILPAVMGTRYPAPELVSRSSLHPTAFVPSAADAADALGDGVEAVPRARGFGIRLSAMIRCFFR